MNSAQFMFLSFACFLAVALRPAFCQNEIFPSQTEKIACTGFDNCTDQNCTTFNRGTSANHTQRYFPNQPNFANCDSLSAQYEYDEIVDPSYLGNVTWNCTTYSNGNKTFTVLELSVTKLPNASVVNCTYQGQKDKYCTVLVNTVNESRFLLGMPGNCSRFVEPTTTPAPTTPAPTTPVPTTTMPTTTPNATTTTSNATTTPKPGPNTTDTTTVAPADATTKSSGNDTSKKDGSGGGQGRLELAATAALVALLVSVFANF